MPSIRTLSRLWLVVPLLAVAACSSGTPTTSPVVSSPSSTSASSLPSAVASAGPSATPSGGSSVPSASAAIGLPVTDASAFRDRLLEMAQAVKFDPKASASTNANKILTAWLTAYPNLDPVLFSSQEATPTRVSYDQTFLIVRQPGTWDQSLSVAVLDTRGTCAGGAIVIPGGATAVSDETVPTIFMRVALRAGAQCSAGMVNETYKPGS